MVFQPNDTFLDFWYQPWHYTHESWLKNTLFQSNYQLSKYDLNAAYILWCNTIGVQILPEPLDFNWFTKYFLHLSPAHAFLATEILGSMLAKDLAHTLNNEQLRWCYQTSLARPIFLNDKQALAQCGSCFDVGLNLLYQMIACHCPMVWQRFLLQFDKTLISDSYLHPHPLLNANMLVIVQKLWLKISQHVLGQTN